jgi:hypothetical protein
MSRLELLDTARHKLRLAPFHGDALLSIHTRSPHDGPDEPLRVQLTAHLEVFAYTGTAAAEKAVSNDSALTP